MPKSIIFGKMMELAVPVVKSYLSDFFHDAKWIDELPDESTRFYYVIRDTGTWITTEKMNLEGTTYLITIVKNDHGKWDFSAEKVLS